MTEPSQISMAVLRSAIEQTLDAVSVDSDGNIKLGDADFYWHLSCDAAFTLDVEVSSADVTVGSLVDDVESVEGMVKRGADDIIVWHDLEHLVGILRRIAFVDSKGNT